MSNLREVYIAIALEVQERLSEEYINKLQFQIAENLYKEHLKIIPERQAKAS
jgi:hypothetical protein